MTAMSMGGGWDSEWVEVVALGESHLTEGTGSQHGVCRMRTPSSSTNTVAC